MARKTFRHKKRDTLRYLLLIINFYWMGKLLVVNFNHENIVFKFFQLLCAA